MRPLGAALAVALLAAACGGAPGPSARVDLIPSNWEVVSVSGAAVGGDAPRILAIGRSSSARIELACGEIDLRYDSVADGGALMFAEQRVAAGCRTPIDEQDTVIRTAISNVRAWRASSATSIELLDQGGRAVLSLNETSCDCPHQPPGTGAPASS